MSEKKHIHMLSELYAHPIAHNIKWDDLIPALSSVGFMHDEKNGSHHFTRNGHTIVFEHSGHDILDENEIIKLRHFLHASAISKNRNPDLAKDMIIAIDHRQAIIFRDPGTTSESRAEEHADLSQGRVLHRRPTAPPYSNIGPMEDGTYYDAVIRDMGNARRIVILSHGTGSSNAASALMTRIYEKNPGLAHQVAAVQRCDLEAMTEPQIVSLGKKLLGSGRTTII
jgi:predicted RNA binding protein YcfA (HicA-like mRNA interferase family)